MTYLEIVSAGPYLISLGAVWSSADVRSISGAFHRKGLMDALSVPIEVVLGTEAGAAALTHGPGTPVGFCVAKRVFPIVRWSI